MKLCTLNGRITPELDNFTFVNAMGNSVLDYIITEHKSINHCLKCAVHTVNDKVSGNEELKSLLLSQYKAPNHRYLVVRKVSDNLAKRSTFIRKYSFYISKCQLLK